jgi:hypothetical protein
MNKGILLLPVLSVDSGRGIFRGLIAENSTSRGDKYGFVDTSSITTGDGRKLCELSLRPGER